MTSAALLIEQRDAARALNRSLFLALGFSPSDQETTNEEVVDYAAHLVAKLPVPNRPAIIQAMIAPQAGAVRNGVSLSQQMAMLVTELPTWRWLPGMAVRGSFTGRLVTTGPELHQNGAAVAASHGGVTQSLQTISLVGVYPDLSDPATLGCMRYCSGLVAELAEALAQSDNGGAK